MASKGKQKSPLKRRNRHIRDSDDRPEEDSDGSEDEIVRESRSDLRSRRKRFRKIDEKYLRNNQDRYGDEYKKKLKHGICPCFTCNLGCSSRGVTCSCCDHTYYFCIHCWDEHYGFFDRVTGRCLYCSRRQNDNLVRLLLKLRSYEVDETKDIKPSLGDPDVRSDFFGCGQVDDLMSELNHCSQDTSDVKL